MKKNLYLQQKRREEVVKSMAKKLAVPGESPEIVEKKRKKKTRNVFVIVAFTIMSMIALSVIFYYVRQELVFHITDHSEEVNCPVALIDDAYNRGEITVNDYGSYLMDILIRYDSLPEDFRVNNPLVFRDAIFEKLANSWDNFRPDLRRSMVKNIPQIEKKLESSQK